MIRRLVWSLLLILLMVLTLSYVFRLPLAQWFIAPTLSDNGVQLHCLDWSINKDIDLHIERLCMTYQGHQIELAGITANTQHIDVARANLNLAQQSKASSDNSLIKPLAFALPAQRPLLKLHRLIVSHPSLPTPLNVAVTEHQLNHFTVTGEVDAKLHLTEQQLSGSLALHQSLLNKLRVINGLMLTSHHDFHFDGVSLQLTSQLAVDYNIQQQNCPLMLHADGQVVSRYQLNESLLQVELGQLTGNLTAQNSCFDLLTEQQQLFAVKNMPLQWQINFPERVELAQQYLTSGAFSLSAIDGKAQLIAERFAVDLSAPWQTLVTALTAKLSSPDINEFSTHAEINKQSVSGQYQLALAKLPEFLPIAARGINSQGQFNIDKFLNAERHGQVTTTLTVNSGQVAELALQKYQGKLTAELNNKQFASVQLISKVASLNYNELKFDGLTNQFTATSDLSMGELFVDLASNTKLNKFMSPELTIQPLTITATGTQSRALQASHHIVAEGIDLLVNHHWSKVAHPFEVIIAEQDASNLNPILQQFLPLLTLTDGTINGKISGDVNLQQADLALQVSAVSALYNDFLAKQLTTQLNARFDSGQLNLAATKFVLNELRAGAIVKEIHGQLAVVNNVPCMSNLVGQVMGGRFVVDNYCITSTTQHALVKFDNIDTSKLITLDDKSGISVTGRVAGSLPVQFSAAGIEVKQGTLYNQGDGKLLITNNAAFAAVKAQQQELSPILGLLENLDIQQLKSSVNLKPDGWLHLGVNLSGYNQAEKQQVNFNYNHEENIFTLLRALRLSDEITQKVEQQYTNKGSNDG
ncbi:YdbH domain-containing protein [Pseudoalteromonas mariniglutinosa]|uniref:YdbH domain-containing protein n=1 Tax=Pseudoalteromonas mariniglutinosa TaxID=206042 RepID=UPI00384DFC23